MPVAVPPCIQIYFSFKPVCFFSGGGMAGEDATEVASMRSCWKLPPCLAEPIPDGLKMDMLLAKVGPIREVGTTSVITYLKRK